MALTREKILKRLEVQERIEGPSEGIEILKTCLSKIKWESQWSALVNTAYRKYGSKSFEVNVFYYPKPALAAILEAFRPRWISVNDRIPEMVHKDMRISDDVVCQDINGRTYIGYVRYSWDDDFPTEPRWTESGRDMYDLEGIVRWISLGDVVAQILPEKKGENPC